MSLFVFGKGQALSEVSADPPQAAPIKLTAFEVFFECPVCEEPEQTGVHCDNTLLCAHTSDFGHSGYGVIQMVSRFPSQQ